MTVVRDVKGPGRPPAATREAVEHIALALMLRDGYGAVSVETIANAAGIGRTTFFRYFGSKSGVVWAPFDVTIAELRSKIKSSDVDGDVLDAIRAAIIYSTRSALYSSEVWLERFKLLDNNPSLRAEAYEHWERWKRVIAESIARNQGIESRTVVPMAIAGACQGVLVTEFRHPQNCDVDREAVLGRLDMSLREICGALRQLLHAPRRSLAVSLEKL
ncbi:TetR family transcriptional regulator (plasmid) [Arthrobacter sp. Z1-9]